MAQYNLGVLHENGQGTKKMEKQLNIIVLLQVKDIPKLNTA